MMSNLIILCLFLDPNLGKNLYIFYSVFFLSFIALYFTLKSAVIYFELLFCMRGKVEVEVNLFAIKLLKEI